MSSFNVEEGTWTMVVDPWTGETATFSLDEIAQFLLWWRGRNYQVRKRTYDQDEFKRQVYEPMHEVNGWMRGCTKERQLVRVTVEDWNRVLTQLRDEERSFRQITKAAKAERSKTTILGQLEGHMGLPNPQSSVLAPENYFDQDDLLDRWLEERKTPEWWVDRPENAARGHFSPLP